LSAENTPDSGAPDTIVLVHGFWVTPLSWEKWVERYEERGYRVLTQILLDHGYGAAGVAIDSVPAEGVRVTPCALIVREHATHPCCREEVLP
jgi:hypothetical protein